MEITETIKTIKFKDLKNYKSPALVMTSLLLLPGTKLDTIKEMNEFFTVNYPLFKKGSLIDLVRITDNVLGDEGRHDYLMVLSEDCQVDPMIRLRVATDVKWLEDFITNFAEDFHS